MHEKPGQEQSVPLACMLPCRCVTKLSSHWPGKLFSSLHSLMGDGTHQCVPAQWCIVGRQGQDWTELVVFLDFSSTVEWPGEQSGHPQASSLCRPILPMLSQWPGSPMSPSLEETFWGPMVQRELELAFKTVFPSGFFFLSPFLFKESLSISHDCNTLQLTHMLWTNTSLYVHLHMYAHICRCAPTYMYTSVVTHTQIYAYTCVYVNTCTHTPKCSCTHISVSSHTGIHACTYIHAHKITNCVITHIHVHIMYTCKHTPTCLHAPAADICLHKPACSHVHAFTHAYACTCVCTHVYAHTLW